MLQNSINGLVVLAVLLIIAFMHMWHLDAQAAEQRDTEPMTDGGDERISTRRGVERVIAEHQAKKRLGGGRARALQEAIAQGAVRGLISGIFLGCEAGLVMNVASFGAVSGILHYMGELMARMHI